MKFLASFAASILFSLLFVAQANAGCNDNRYGGYSSYGRDSSCSPAERQIEGLKADGIEWGRILGNRFLNVGTELMIAPFEDFLAVSRVRRAVRLRENSVPLIRGLEATEPSYAPPLTGGYQRDHSSMNLSSLGLTPDEAEALRSGRARVVRR
jgi:hypothetical protein